MNRLLLSFSLVATMALQAQDLTGYSAKGAKAQDQLETQFRESIDKSRFKTHLKTLTEHPHIAGTPANEKVKDYIVNSMSKAGLDVKTYPYEVYMSSDPGESLVEVISPEGKVLDQ